MTSAIFRLSKFPPVLLLGLAICHPLKGEGLKGKVMCGYQGWFRAPADGTGNGWRHYTEHGPFEPGHCSIDLWPDVRELPEKDRIPTGFKHPDGSVAEVYSSVRASATDLHFQWMKEYGIDGAFLQRFAVSTRNKTLRATLDQVLMNCQNAAQAHGRSWVLMYDLSGLRPGQSQALIDDWKHLKDNIGLKKEAYLTHNKKPLISLWGLGFNDRPAMLDEWKTLIDFFKNDPTYGGCSIMVGVPTYWRTLRRDTIKDPALHQILETVDVISPWSVGRYNSPKAAAEYARETLTPDIAWCRERKIDLLPVAFPGFSWQNMMKIRGKEAKLNVIPRLGGGFLWSQAWHARKAGAGMLYVAMFDELDEGTAIFKTRTDPPSGKSNFVTEPGIPGDQYLWLTGKAGEMFRSKPDSKWSTLPRREK
ncbi:glycoside hydrolase family 71/99-like protein [Verrucomicrobiaceae bacterium 227]